eukprot:TRINITY_DN6990_c0_g2_i5.p1 TRINITY_DN6990_c0_g2~~TRINITY_DN6990_c0_g2_i5.p1  ORF type:complete len:219 (+),score=59.11 TRINITY_DN6990_c0_g2_i5:35-691(+)
MATSASVIIGYWAVQGEAEPLRQLAEYLHIPYVNKKYTNSEEWSADMANINTPSPSLPYLIDGDQVVTGIFPITLHLVAKAKREDFLDMKPDDRLLARVIGGAIGDLTKDVMELAYNPNWETELPKAFAEKITPQLKKLSEFLADKKFFLGDKVSLVEFPAYYIFNLTRVINAAAISEFPNIVSFINNYENIQEIKEYLASERYQKKPILNPNGPMKI